ncbi:MAG TPA: hypothetical protein VLT36_05645 [Candidatus Dormibacteraeota bacterium]|nr:hypothetical protein [Candidatus Dormibacteraeota bacterium]
MNRKHRAVRTCQTGAVQEFAEFGLSLFVVVLLVTLYAPLVLASTTPLDEESPWPRVRSANGNQVTLYLPQVERWTSNWFSARAPVDVKPARAKKEILGVIWFEAHGTVDHSKRVVTLDRFEVTRGRFPDAPDKGSNALAIVREIVPTGARTVSLDYLITSLGFQKAAARQGPQGLKHTPPEIIWATNRTVLVLIDGEPILRSVSTTTPPGAEVKLDRVVNTPVLLLRENSNFYLNGQERWFTASEIKGPWALAQNPPPEIAALAQVSTNPPTGGNEAIPRIIVRTTPAELLMTSGFPDFRPIRGTSLQYAADTDSQLFFDNSNREAYVLFSGRWFKAKALNGPWTHVGPHDLPADFARIPPGSPQAVVLAAVPETPQAELALLANTVPKTATIKRREAKLTVTYDCEPKLEPIEGTSMTYAINARVPVIRTGDDYYAVDDAVWFKGSSPNGPWEVAAGVPEEIYTIPPSSPVYYATFARVYDASEEEVDVGYTPGYEGAYEDDGTVIYGTGYDYEPWHCDDYYSWGGSWGYNHVYLPRYGWWVWRPCWSPPGGLRAMVVQNIYDRWQSGNRVTPYGGAGPAGARASYPALYGRYSPAWTSSRTTASWPKWSAETQGLPGNTLLVNPYTRPRSPVRAGEIPRGAQTLTAVSRAPGGGRDLYASPDGNVYRRANDSWYRRDAGNQWTRIAPTQGKIEGDRLAATRAAEALARASGPRPVADRDGGGTRAQALANRVPDSGDRLREREIEDLERQYYARSLAEARANRGGNGGGARGGRGGGGGGGGRRR